MCVYVCVCVLHIVEWFYKDLKDLLELIPERDILFIIGYWKPKVGRRDTWNKRQIWPWSTKWSRATLTEFFQENAFFIPKNHFQQPKRWVYTGISPGGQCWNQSDYNVCTWRWRISVQSAKTWPGADCGSDHELLYSKFRLKLKKVGKTIRPFRYDLNKILMIIQWKWQIDSRAQLWMWLVIEANSDAVKSNIA